MFEWETRILLSFIADKLSEQDDRLDHGLIKRGKRSPRKKRENPKPYPPSESSDRAITPPETAKTGTKLVFKINNQATNPSRHINCTYFISNEIAIFKNANVKAPTETPSTSGSSKSINLVENPKLITCNRKRVRTDQDDHYLGESTSKKLKKAKNNTTPQILSPPIPEVFKNHILGMGGCLDDLKLVIMKELTATDLSGSHVRLSIPYSQVSDSEFLTESELRHLDVPKAEILATLIEPSLEECRISLRNWKSNRTFVLVSAWKGVFLRNQLSPGNRVQLWSFRGNSELCFALVVTDRRRIPRVEAGERSERD